MQRSVIPEGLMLSSSPHTFSLGVCRLTMTIECGSMSPANKSIADFRVSGDQPKENCRSDDTTASPRLASFNLPLPGQRIAKMQNHQSEACKHNDTGEPSQTIRGPALI